MITVYYRIDLEKKILNTNQCVFPTILSTNIVIDCNQNQSLTIDYEMNIITDSIWQSYCESMLWCSSSSFGADFQLVLLSAKPYEDDIMMKYSRRYGDMRNLIMR